MAVVTKGDDGREPMADDARPQEHARPRPDEDDDREESRELAGRERSVGRTGPAAPAAAAKAGFFHIYKPGQGYWTRMCTVCGSLLLLVVIAYFVFDNLKAYFGPPSGPLTVPWIAGIASAFFVAGGILLWYYLNKPAVVDFFIATESEMKKVNWTSRKELFGSTRVVIIFMFLLAAFLFVVDVVFGYLFHLIKILNQGPFGG